MISLLLFENDDQLDQMLMNKIPEENKKKKPFAGSSEKSLNSSWLLQKIAEVGKGPYVLDKGGQDTLQFAIIVSGVTV